MELKRWFRRNSYLEREWFVKEEETSKTRRNEIGSEISDGSFKRRESFKTVDITSPHCNIEEKHNPVLNKDVNGELSGDCCKSGVESCRYCPRVPFSPSFHIPIRSHRLSQSQTTKPPFTLTAYISNILLNNM